MHLPDYTFLCDIARQAGKEIMGFYPPRPDQIDQKSDQSPVTLADKAADRIILDALQARYPHVACVTEEQAETHTAQTGAFFLVDPLDGTKEFIHARGDFTVNIAYLEAGTPLMGVIYMPVKDQLYFTTAAQEAFVQEAHGAVRRISADMCDPDAPVRVVASRSHMDAKTKEFLTSYTVSEQKSAGSSLKFATVAEGQADIYPRFGPTMEWDIAAGDAILRAAGGMVIDWNTQEPMCYGKPDFRNGPFVAFGQRG